MHAHTHMYVREEEIIVRAAIHDGRSMRRIPTTTRSHNIYAEDEK